MASSPRHWLVDDKTPFLLAILLGGLAWCVDHVADRAAELPIVQYRQLDALSALKDPEHYQQCPKSKGLHPYVYAVENISARHSFRNLNLYFYQASKKSISEATWITQPPGWVESTSSPCNTERLMPGILMTLSELQWSWHGLAVVWAEDKEAPLILYRADAAESKPDSESPSVLLVEANFTTWVIRNEFQIYYALIALFFILIITFVVVYVRRV
jgi:hypothetical protein